ncbi:hypothetical protein CEXT_495441 [Caerostris extrusa]|nr:hypothetical protein CEXT_495441 [Caerostris extrusa]
MLMRHEGHVMPRGSSIACDCAPTARRPAAGTATFVALVTGGPQQTVGREWEFRFRSSEVAGDPEPRRTRLIFNEFVCAVGS